MPALLEACDAEAPLLPRGSSGDPGGTGGIVAGASVVAGGAVVGMLATCGGGMSCTSSFCNVVMVPVVAVALVVVIVLAVSVVYGGVCVEELVVEVRVVGKIVESSSRSNSQACVAIVLWRT